MTRWSLIVTALVVTLTGCGLQPNDNTLPGQKAIGDDGYTVIVEFDNVENLVANSNVQMDDVTVGTVAAIDVRPDWKAWVKLRLLKSKPITRKATFAIGQKTLLGAQFVEIIDRPGNGSPALRDGDVIGVAQTGSYPQTEQVLGAASLLLNNGGLSQISTITGELSRSLNGRVPRARDLVARLNELLAVLDDNKSQIIATLEAVNSLSATLDQQRTTVARALRRIGPGLQVLNNQREALVDAVTRTGRLSTQAGRIVAVNEQAILSNLDALNPILNQLGRVSDQLPEALKFAVTVPFPLMTATDGAIFGDYGNLFATIDVSASALAENFAGFTIPPALQAGDPMLGPLAGLSPKGSTKPGTTKDATPTPSTKPGSSKTPSGAPSSPSPTARPTPTSCGLLVLLGAC